MPHRTPAASTLALDAVDRFLGAVADDDRSAEHVGAALNAHIAALASVSLPSAAHDIWTRVARLLRAPPDEPIPEKATHAIRSWPQARVSELTAHIRNLHAVLEKVENDRLEDEIRDNIRRHYL
jgi:hypothetical protein